jgi:hypothetical protein
LLKGSSLNLKLAKRRSTFHYFIAVRHGQGDQIVQFLPIGRLLTLNICLKITQVSQIFGPQFFNGRRYVLILTKMGWTTFCAIS